MRNLLNHGLHIILLGGLLLWPLPAQSQPHRSDDSSTPAFGAPLENPGSQGRRGQPGDGDVDRPRFGGPGGPNVPDFGPPPDGPPPNMLDPFNWPDALDRWRDEDRRIKEKVEEYKKIEAQRNTLLKALNEVRSHYNPDNMDTQAILTRQKVNNILAQLHELVEADKKNVDEAARQFGFTSISMRFWGPVFKERMQEEGDKLDPEDAKRLRIWIEGYEKSKQANDPEALAVTLMGDEFGPIVYQTARQMMEEMGQRMSRGGPHRGPGLLKRESQGRWIVRIQRLEKRQEDLQNELDGLGREIERLRRMLESDASWENDKEAPGKSSGLDGAPALAPPPPQPNPMPPSGPQSGPQG